MARWAMVKEDCGCVVNVVEWDGGSGLAAPAGYVMVEDADGKAGPGFSYDGTQFVPPPGLEPAPAEEPAE